MKKSNIVDIEEGLPHRLAETICVKCFQRSMTIWPEKTQLKELECENCGKGYIIMTGQPLKEENSE